MLATFMPKPFSHLTGNGLHMHLSLWDGERGDELFADAEDGRGLGMSALGYSFIGGLLEHAEALAAVACPTVNSYKRLGQPGRRTRVRPGRPSTPPTAATTARTCCGCPTPAGSRTAASTARPIRTWP